MLSPCVRGRLRPSRRLFYHRLCIKRQCRGRKRSAVSDQCSGSHPGCASLRRRPGSPPYDTVPHHTIPYNMCNIFYHRHSTMYSFISLPIRIQLNFLTSKSFLLRQVLAALNAKHGEALKNIPGHRVMNFNFFVFNMIPALTVVIF